MDTTSELHRQFERIASASPSERDTALAEIRANKPDLADRLSVMLRTDAGESFLDHMAHRSANALEQACAAPLPLGVPPSIGAYTVTRSISSGGTSLVCEGRDTVSGDAVAIKILRFPDVASDHLRRFEREALALRRVEHESVVRIMNHGTLDSGEPYIVMELVPGEPLATCNSARSAPLDEKTELIRRIAEAAHQLHLKGVVHRDLKPTNIMIRPDGAPVIIDLGIALLDEAPGGLADRVTRTGYAPGTPDYMSPEQLRGAELDARSDVYSLGVLAYWLIGGVVPIEVSGLSPAGAETRVTHERPPALERSAPEARGDLSRVVDAALAKSPGDRYSSAAELAMELTRVLVGDPISVGPPSLSRRVARWSRRHRGRVRAGAAAIAVLLVAGVSVSFAMARAHDASTRADRLEQGLNENSSIIPKLVMEASRQRLGPNATFMEIFVAFVSKSDFESMPLEARTATYRLVSQSFITLQAFEHALPYAERSAELHADLYGPGSVRSLIEQITYARALQLTGDIDAAERELAVARSRAPKNLGDSSPMAAALLSGREGKVHLERGRLVDAERKLLESRDFWERSPDADPVMVPGTDLWLGRVYRARGLPEDALRVLRRGLGINDALRHEMHPRSVRLRIEIALVAADTGDTERAVALLSDELERCLEHPRLGPDEPVTGEVLGALATLQGDAHIQAPPPIAP